MKKAIRLRASNDIGPGEAGWQANGCARKNSRRNCEGISRQFSKLWNRIPTDDESVSSRSSRLHSIRLQGTMRETVELNRACRGVAQPGSVLAWGASGRPFKSARPDQYIISAED